MAFMVSPKGARRWTVLDGTALGSLCPALPNLSVNCGWGWSYCLHITGEDPPLLEVGRRVLRAGCTKGQLYVGRACMLGCFPKGKALLSPFEVVCFLLCLVPCSQLGSWPCIWDLAYGFQEVKAIS